MVHTPRLIDPVMHSLGSALGLPPEKQVVTMLEVGIPVGPTTFGGEEPAPGWSLLGEKGGPILVLMAVHQVPVVQASTPPGLLGHVESDGVYHVQAAGSGGGGPADVSRVVGDLGLDKHDVEQWRGHSGSLPSAGGLLHAIVRDLPGALHTGAEGVTHHA